MSRYNVWRKQRPENSAPSVWIKTAHTIEARSEREAAAKMKRRFFDSQFSLMSLVAIPEGQMPFTGDGNTFD